MLKNIKYFAEQSWLLIVASFFFGLLLAVTNAAWRPMIVQNEINKFNSLARDMLLSAGRLCAKGPALQTKSSWS